MKFFSYLQLYVKAHFLAVPLLLGGSLSAQSILENTQLRFFTDAGFKAGRDTTDRLAPEFQSSGIEILITSQITDRISLLAEPVLRPNGTISIERAMLKYSFSTYLNISAGRLYVPIGLWNTTFFRFAKALTPTIDAPLIIANMEEGGVAINKDNGIMVSGDDISKLRFGYRVMVGNGYNQANSRKKYYIANVFIEPIDNLRFSVSASTTKTAGIFYPTEVSIDGLILACMYMGGKNIEFAYEYYRGHIHNATFNTSGDVHYGYVGYKIKKVTPYAQYYNGVTVYEGAIINLTNVSLGVRYNFTPLSVVKAEAQFLESDDFSKINQIKLLWAIGF
jgi:hypothetical protein